MKLNLGKLLILAPIIIGLCYAILWFYPSISLGMNQSLWSANETSEYQMQIAESRPDGGPWRWSIHVKDGEVISSKLLDADTHGKPNNRSWLDPTSLTVESLFVFARQHCSNRGFLDCGIAHDPQYHFPNLISSYEMITVRVESFINCSKEPTSCVDF